MALYTPSGVQVQAVSYVYGGKTVVVRNMATGAVMTMLVSDLKCPQGEAEKARELRAVRTPR